MKHTKKKTSANIRQKTHAQRPVNGSLREMKAAELIIIFKKKILCIYAPGFSIEGRPT